MRSFSPGYRNQKTPTRRSRRILILFAVLVIAMTGVIFYLKSRPATVVSVENKPAETKNIPADKAEGNYLFNGTVVLARAVENQARGDYDQPFSGLYTFSPEKYDAWFSDFECPVTNQNIPYRQQVENTMFNCRPEFLPSYRKYFEFANIAGNHTLDLGQDGYKQTVKNLENAGIVPLGNYSPRVKEDICEVVPLKIRLKKAGRELKDKTTLPVAICAFHYFSFDPEPGEIETIKAYSEKMPVFALQQIGTEYVASAGPDQVDVARRLIDNGADFVIGNSPHWVQNSEVYKGKLIAYSTGNFIFDQLDSETNRGVSIAVNMSVDYDDNLAKWLALSEKCRPRYDSCLEEAKKQNLQKVSAKYKFEAIGNTNGYRQITKKADPTTQAAILKRLNWDATLRALGQR